VIEDDLEASPVLLRKEIRRLRALLPEKMQSIPIENRDMVLAVMSRKLCPLRGMDGVACACPGTCVKHADEILKDLEASGFVVLRQR